MKKIIFLGLLSTLLVAGCVQDSVIGEIPDFTCTNNETGKTMTLEEAVDIAQSSECVQEGQLIIDESFCNDYTGTWWIELTAQKEGCNPACVVDIETETAEINWRCTGLIV